LAAQTRFTVHRFISGKEAHREEKSEQEDRQISTEKSTDLHFSTERSKRAENCNAITNLSSNTEEQ